MPKQSSMAPKRNYNRKGQSLRRRRRRPTRISIEERRVLQAAQSRKAMAEMEITGRENMSNSVNNHISQLDRQIKAIQAQLGASSIPARRLPSAIIDIDANGNIHADESDMRAQQAPKAPDEDGNPGSNAWSKIAFTIVAKSESTSFIVAADTVLEFKSTESKSEELMSHLSTDSSIKANYGPWGLSGGASLKMDSKDSSMKMEVRGGALRISFADHWMAIGDSAAASAAKGENWWSFWTSKQAVSFVVFGD